MNFVCGIWCGAGTRCLVRLPYNLSLVRGIPTYCLVPEVPDLDHMEPEIKELGAQVRRTHGDERVAMRDLVAEIRADAGILLYAHCNVTTLREVRLARSRLEHGWTEYKTSRVKAYVAARWLEVGDTNEFVDWDGTI